MFNKRSYEKELLDRDDIPFDDIRRNMDELEFINEHLGGHRITISGLRYFLHQKQLTGKKLVLAEIGCGGGDNLIAIHKWCSKSNIALSLIGIDINPHCIEVAKKKLLHTTARLICSDYRLVTFDSGKPDILFSSLFCHHFNDTELLSMLSWMQSNSELGFFINDLHRHPLAYYAIKLLSRLFSNSYLVKHDAPLSVLRGFSRQNLQELLTAAGIDSYSLHWKWAFRYLLIVDRSKAMS